jgi:hypothetical protein
MVKCKVKINEDTWTVRTVGTKEMQKEREDGEYIAGLCITGCKTILIHVDHLDEPTVCHELYHAYFHSLHLDDTNDLSVGDFEEISASFFTEKAAIILSKAKKVTKKLQKLYEKELNE